MSLKQTRPQIILDSAFLILITGIAIYFRFTNFSQNPGIYNDEGTLLNISINLFQGKAEYLGIQGSWLLAGRMPVFPWLLAFTYNFVKPDLWVLRLFTASSGVLSVILLFLFLRSLPDSRLIFLKYLSPLVLAIHPKFVLFNRIGFGYNLLIPLTIIILWFLWTYAESKQDRWLVFASLVAGLGLLIELAYISFIAFIVLAVAFINLRKAPYAILLSLFALLIYFSASYSLYGNWFLFDWQVTFGRGTSLPFLNQIGKIILNFIFFVFDDYSVLISILGVISLPNRRLGVMALLGIVIPYIITARTFSTLSHSYYYFLPYIPFVAIGISNTIIQVSKWIFDFSDELTTTILSQKVPARIMERLKVFLFDTIFLFTIIAPAAVLIIGLHLQTTQQFQTSFDHLLINTEEFNQVTDFVNHLAEPGDLIIASPAVAWALNANTTDYQISIAVNESPTIHFPQGIPKERMRFESSIEKADYVIIDPIMRSWKSYEIPGIEEWIIKVETEWLQVMQTKTISVFRNPVH